MGNIKKLIITAILLMVTVTTSYADGTRDNVENTYEYRAALNFQIKLAKGLKLDLEPELRFADGFDKLMLNGGLSYKTFGFIYWGAAYRLVADRSGSGYSAEWDNAHRLAFDVTYKDNFKRFTPSFRLRYTTYTNEDMADKDYLRYQAKLDYDIPKCKITPFVSIEAFQEMEDLMLYKMRYTAGFEYKVSKKASLSLNYKLDFFNLEYKNSHIFSAGYKYKF